MAVYKDKNGTWYVSARYDNWQGEHARKVKRGFKTKKDAMEWERDFLLEKAGSLDMTFEAFVELYKTNLKERLKQSTWQTKISIIDNKILPYFRKKRMLKTALEEPEKIGELGYLLQMITKEDIVPDEFRDLYATFKKTLRLK